MKSVGFICTGNTCRSPMAECYFKHIVKGKGKEMKVFSAGLSAGYGWRAAKEGIRLMKRFGLDLTKHISRPLDDKMVDEADMLLVMTDMHKETLIRKWPFAANRVYFLREFSENADKMIDFNVMDPVGCPIELYEKCFDLMKEPLDRLGDIVCKESF